jgi:hypothetical protein
MRLPALALAFVCALASPGCDDPDAQVVQGTIRVAPGAERPIGGSETLFITARPAGAKGGPPLAVLKVVGMTFPTTYRIGQEDVVMPGSWFRGKVEIRAVLRRSGFVSAPAKGDLESAPSAAVEPGAKGVDLELAPAP